MQTSPPNTDSNQTVVHTASFNTTSPPSNNNEWDFFVDLTPSGSLSASLNSEEEDGPLFKHMSGKLDKRNNNNSNNNSKLGTFSNNFVSSEKNKNNIGKSSNTAFTSNVMGNNKKGLKKSSISNPSEHTFIPSSSTNKNTKNSNITKINTGGMMKKMPSSPNKMLLSPSCPNLSQMGKQGFFNTGASRPRPSNNIRGSRNKLYKRTSLSVATSTLFQLRRSGRLIKRGFRFWKSWVERWVVLRARMLSYYEINVKDVSQINNLENTYNPRGTLELSSGTIVRDSNKDGKPFCFEVVPLPPMKEDAPVRLADAEFEVNSTIMSKRPNSSQGNSTYNVNDNTNNDNSNGAPLAMIGNINPLTISRSSSNRSTSPTGSATSESLLEDGKIAPTGPIWYLQASSEEEKQLWMNKIQQSIDLIIRCESRPTLTGMGSVHDHYKIGEIIGVGRFGVVRACTNKRSRLRCAAKIINRKKHLTTEMTRKIVENEIRLLRLMSRLTETKDHPNIIKVHEVYEDSFLIYIVVDVLRGGDLFDHVASAINYSEQDVAYILHGVLSGLKILHDVGIIHRDLKPENLLFKLSADKTVKPIVKIADFGLSGTLRQFDRHAKEIGRTIVVGTPGYVAPEVISKRFYSPACDIYSLGVVLYLMLVGYPPIAGQQKTLVLTKTINAEWGFVMSDWRSISSSSLTLVGSMLTLDVNERISINECLNFQWVLRASSRKLLKESQDRIKMFVDKRRRNMRGGLMSIMATPLSHHEKLLTHSPTRVQSFINNGMNDNGNSLMRNSMSMNNIKSLGRASASQEKQNITMFNLKNDDDASKNDGALINHKIDTRKQPSLSDVEERMVSDRLKKTGFLE